MRKLAKRSTGTGTLTGTITAKQKINLAIKLTAFSRFFNQCEEEPFFFENINTVYHV